ncbi:restriction endonuclease [Gordonia sp. UCD-TK1]|uniref:restriction endonuclease n=1 Tax=Gordonia sp. UCD-TK1 TaxID=1857893 RepID=UPI00080E6435|nr:restriction endonuclease [Gordonia sp. UCD-TK1]OCH81142.1 restriction endonuclease [Gordonia sp. UCD-TK1]
MTSASRVSELPVWQGFLRPILEVMSDRKTRSRRELVADVLAYMQLTDEQLGEHVATGGNRAEGRCGWALSDLVRAEFVDRPRRATYQITDPGIAFLAEHTGDISDAHLKLIPAYQAYTPSTSTGQPRTPVIHESAIEPLEQINEGVARLHDEVKTDLIKRIREQTPDFLESAVLELLVAMGYGGTEQKATRLGGTGDGGVDGVIDQDALGLDQIYVQAKRYGQGNTVGRPDIQAFVGALHGMGASRGIFITTSSFSPGAREYANSVSTRIILIDGERLAALMIKYGIGVQTRDVFTIVEVDEDFFD